MKYQGRLFATMHIRANIPVQRGEGGAPLLNARGDVVGVLISRVESGNASHVLPIEAAEKVRQDFMRFHKVRPGWLGVQVKTLESPVSGSTAAVDGTISDSPAEKAGLQSGDVIVQVGNRHVTCPEDVLDASFFLTAEDQTTIRVARDGSERDFSITPIDNPLNRPPIASFDSNSEQPETPSPALQIGH
jgi:S1-C subfamily serine protease